jgi:hypothetical protein
LAAGAGAPGRAAAGVARGDCGFVGVDGFDGVGAAARGVAGGREAGRGWAGAGGEAWVESSPVPS